jgi:hypothetical protein
MSENDGSQSRRLTDAEKRLEELVESERDETEDVTLDVQYHDTIISADGTRIRVPILATYSEDVPFGERFWHPELKRWMRIRARWPVRDTSESCVKKEVTGG